MMKVVIKDLDNDEIVPNEVTVEVQPFPFEGDRLLDAYDDTKARTADFETLNAWGEENVWPHVGDFHRSDGFTDALVCTEDGGEFEFYFDKHGKVV